MAGICSFLLVDSLFFILHSTHGERIDALNLDIERNVPTYYQSLKLALVGSVFFALMVTGHFLRTSGHKPAGTLSTWALAPMWLGFTILAIDEVGEIHENVPRYLDHLFPNAVRRYWNFFASLGYESIDWLVFFVPVLAVALVYAFILFRHLRQEEIRPLYLGMLFIGAAITLGGPVMEYVNTSPGVPGPDNGFRLHVLHGVEEYAEMVGISFFLGFSLLLLRDQARSWQSLLRPRDAKRQPQ